MLRQWDDHALQTLLSSGFAAAIACELQLRCNDSLQQDCESHFHIACAHQAGASLEVPEDLAQSDIAYCRDKRLRHWAYCNEHYQEQLYQL